MHLRASQENQVTNEDAIEATLASFQLSWTGYLLREENVCMPKQPLYGKLGRRKRRVRGQKFRFKGTVQAEKMQRPNKTAKFFVVELILHS